jgi:hypothetical protein
MFGGQDVQEVSKPKYIRPGVLDVTIKSVKGETNQNGNPTIVFSMHLVDGDAEATTDFRFYLSEKAAVTSYKKIRHIFTKVVKDADYLAATADSVEGLGEAYNTKLAGKSLRIKFRGEEYLKQDGNTGTRAVIGLPEFAEAILDGAEYPVVADTKLTFNAEVDVKKLTKQPDAETSGGFFGSPSNDPGF